VNMFWLLSLSAGACLAGAILRIRLKQRNRGVRLADLVSAAVRANRT
jgi:hypothetical protein